MLRKRIHPYKYMDNWKRYNETLLPDNKEFYSNLNMEALLMLTISTQRVRKNFKIKKSR